MKDLINLLPPQAIKLRTQRIYLARLGTLQRRLVGVVGLLVLVVAGSTVILTLIKQDLTRDSLAADETANKILSELTNTNQRLTLISAWVRDHEPWTPFLDDVFKVIPAGVELTEVSASEREHRLEIKGVISSREAVLTFQRRLEALPWIEKLEAPLSNFETGDKTNFVFVLFRAGAEAEETPPPSDSINENQE